MSDLSWLNPTPHAIAVYASRPLSPVAAQHSLPSGRYSLLGPDFHRLDRTSLRLAHSFDHLVGDGEHSGWNIKAEHFCGLEIDHQLELGRLQHRQVGRFLAFENAANVDSNLSIGISQTGAIADKPSSRRKFAAPVYRRNCVAGCKRCDLVTLAEEERISRDYESIVP